MEYGLQMWSLRDMTETDFEGALKKVAEIGYKKVELAGFFGRSGEEIKAMLDHYGLTCCSTHTILDEILPDLDATIRFHHALGNENLVIPHVWSDTKERLDLYIENINKIQPILKAEGIHLHFHNHSQEFLKKDYGQVPYDELVNRTDLLFQVDTFWAFNAGLDPIRAVKRLGDRVKMIHLKDGFRGEQNGDGAQGKSLGMGEAPVEAVRKMAIELGLGMVVESEGCDPTGIEEVTRCIEYLKKLDQADGI